MRRSYSIACLAAFALAWSAATPAQSPADVARQVFAALDSADWSRVAALAHPEALKRFHAQKVREAQDEEESRADPSVPAEFRNHKAVYALIYKVQSADQLDSMPAPVMLSHFLRAYHPQRTQRGTGSDGFLAFAGPRRIVGTVMDGDSVAYVVFINVTRRGTGEDSDLVVPPDLPRAMTLKRDGGTWKTMLDGGLVWGMDAIVGFSDGDGH